jgi:Undecaprenyl-phosphate glucose phosphotransferase
MYRRHGQKLSLVFWFGDLVLVATMWLLAYWLRFTWLPHRGVPDVTNVLGQLPIVLLLATISFRVCGLYEIHRLQRLPQELGSIGKAVLLLFVLVIAETFYIRDEYESRLALAMFFGMTVVSLTLQRRCLWWALAWLRRHRGLNHGKALIVGAGRTGRLVAQALQENHWTGLEAVGFVDQPRKYPPKRLPYLGSIENLGEIAQTQDVDYVFIALPVRRYSELPSVYRQISGLPVEIQLVPDLPDLAAMRVRMQEIDGVAFLGLRQRPHDMALQTVKRLGDIVGSLILLVVLSPLLLGLATAVKLTSPGPILFAQQRAGLNGRRFWMLKFRTMRTDAERTTGAVWARRGDDRCTPLGRVLRRWSLDELPQLLNVLAGHMSLVGPRPERPVFVEQFQRQLPTYPWRHAVKSGITGWAQVNGWRGNTSLRRRLEYDFYYINHWSLWLDLKILGMTLWSGFRHKNAY